MPCKPWCKRLEEEARSTMRKGINAGLRYTTFSGVYTPETLCGVDAG